MFDKLIDQHKNVHKTEQFNDVYSAVSGVPNQVDTHVMEMANFIIDLMKNIENFKMEDLTKTKLQVRAGAHTGAFLLNCQYTSHRITGPPNAVNRDWINQVQPNKYFWRHRTPVKMATSTSNTDFIKYIEKISFDNFSEWRLIISVFQKQCKKSY